MSSEPVILKMSCNESPASGKGELWIIGQSIILLTFLKFQVQIKNSTLSNDQICFRKTFSTHQGHFPRSARRRLEKYLES